MAGPSIQQIYDTSTGEYRSLTTDDLTGASGSASDPSIVQGTDGALAERLATFAEQQDQTTELEGIRAEQATEAKQDTIIARLEQIRDQGAAIAPAEPTEHQVTAVAALLPALATPNGFRIQVPESATDSVFVRKNAAVTTTGANRGWEVPAGTSRFFNWNTTTGVYAISTGTVEILIEVEP